ncbi:unnamed protein product [Cochlearia groenlandica]
MKEEEALPMTTATGTATANPKKDNSSESALFGRGRYKFWAFAAILLLAFWSMFTGTVTLRLSTGNLNRFSVDLASQTYENLDALEMEDREKVVKHMWDVYTNVRRIKLSRFWQEAFVAAYEELTSDVTGVRDAAIGEIAKMSVRSITLDPPPSLSMGASDLGRSLKRMSSTQTSNKSFTYPLSFTLLPTFCSSFLSTSLSLPPLRYKRSASYRRIIDGDVCRSESDLWICGLPEAIWKIVARRRVVDAVVSDDRL